MAEISKIGTGMEFPTTLQNGKGIIVTNSTLINQSIQDILTTDMPTFFVGERRSLLSQFLFEPNDLILQAGLKKFIIKALNTWETRIKDVSLQFNIEESLVNCIITYRIQGDTKSDTFIYPFYKELKY